MKKLCQQLFLLIVLMKAGIAFAETIPTTIVTTTATTNNAPAAITSPAPETTSPPPAVSKDSMNAAQFNSFLKHLKLQKAAQARRKLQQKHMRVPPPRPLTYEEGQQVMLNSVPSMAISEDSNIAFEGLLQQNMPMSPQQVVKLRQRIDLAQRAAAVTPNIPPKPVSSTIMVNQAPGATPPAIRLSQGYVSSLVFVDSTGTPWPIASFDIGNPKTVNMQWDGKSNILLIQAISPYISGDLVIRLVGLPMPITLELVSGQRVVDYRIDLHVSGIGPNTKDLPQGTDLPNSASQLLLGVLDGVAPPGSQQLSITGAANTQIWMLGDKMYLRTRFTLLSPGWVGKMVSPDGMTAYELPRTSSVLVSRYGEPVQLKIEGL